MTDEREQGTVKFWNGNSYGFLLPDNPADTEIFFHKSEIFPDGRMMSAIGGKADMPFCTANVCL
jgi:cold shock CspA family protein